MNTDPISSHSVRKISFYTIFGFLILTAMGGVATPFITVLFSFFALTHLRYKGKNWTAVILFLALVLSIFYGFIYFVGESLVTLPRVAETAIPKAVEYAEKKGIALPFSNVETLKALTVEGIHGQLRELAKFTQVVTKEFVFLIIGLVVAISIFLSRTIDLAESTGGRENNLYSALCKEISIRFATFYSCFRTVMGAQLLISGINTLFTAIFVYAVGLPFAHIIVVITFLCGLLPIIGNLLSNTIICAIGLTQSPETAVFALAFLVALHKLEYFLNSKIIGKRIKNPMWLTLLGLIAGERIMGIPGMILAPVILNYLRVEGSQFFVENKS